MIQNTANPQLFSNTSGYNVHGGVFIAYNNQPPIQSSSSTPAGPVPTSQSAPQVLTEPQLKTTCIKHLSPSERYSWLLLPQGRGYPLWKPKADSSHLPEKYRQKGVHIGDIGILNEFGGFEFLFNACHPADDPLNIAGVPPDFEHLELDGTRISDSQYEFKPGSRVVSESCHFRQSIIPHPAGQAPIPGVPKEVGAGLSFSSSATQGALLILPEGAKRSDHQQYAKFEAYAAKYAHSWYNYVNGPLACGVPPGAIYFITGFDKARAWGVASFKNAQEDVCLEFVPQKSDKEGAPRYWFSRYDFAECDADDDHIFQNQSGSVFLRGFKIAVRQTRNPFRPVAAKVEKIQGLDADELFPDKRGPNMPSSPRPFAPYQVYAAPGRPSPTYGGVQPNNHTGDNNYPGRYQPYHPSDVINTWILSNHEEVDVAITHDDDWSNVINHEEEIPADEDLIHKIQMCHDFIHVQAEGLNYACFASDLPKGPKAMHHDGLVSHIGVLYSPISASQHDEALVEPEVQQLQTEAAYDDAPSQAETVPDDEHQDSLSEGNEFISSPQYQNIYEADDSVSSNWSQHTSETAVSVFDLLTESHNSTIQRAQSPRQSTGHPKPKKRVRFNTFAEVFEPQDEFLSPPTNSNMMLPTTCHMNPVLKFHHSSPKISWDMSYPIEMASLDPAWSQNDWKASATDPSVENITVIFGAWRVLIVPQPESRVPYVTVLDVLHGLYRHFRQPTLQSEFDSLSPDEQKLVTDAYMQRWQRLRVPAEREMERSKGVKNIDYLAYDRLFWGLKPNKDCGEWLLQVSRIL